MGLITAIVWAGLWRFGISYGENLLTGTRLFIERATFRQLNMNIDLKV